MAQQKLIDLDLLTRYDGKIKDLMSTEDAKAVKYISYDSSTRVVSFFKTEDGTGTAAFTVTLPDTSNFIEKIANGASGNFVVQDANGALVDGGDSIDADKIDYDNTTSGLTATDAQAAIDEIAAQSAGGVASKNIWVEDVSAGQSDYAKVYKIYQCATQNDESVSTLKGTINIPKDLFIKSASVETVVTPDVPYSGAAVGDKYIDIEVQNQQAHLYVPCNALVDEYTAEQNASQIQLAIDANNVISATVVAGSIDTTELAASAVTTAKIADSNVTTAKIADENVTLGKLASGVQTSLGLADSAVQSVAEGATNGTVAVDGTDVAVHGLGSAAYTASTDYEVAGAAAAAVAALDSNTSTATDTADSGLVVLTEVGIVDGMISTKKSKTLGTACTYADTDFLKTADYTTASNSDIDNLFN